MFSPGTVRVLTKDSLASSWRNAALEGVRGSSPCLLVFLMCQKALCVARFLIRDSSLALVWKPFVMEASGLKVQSFCLENNLAEI